MAAKIPRNLKLCVWSLNLKPLFHALFPFFPFAHAR